jgi:hypothetical protein
MQPSGSQRRLHLFAILFLAPLFVLGNLASALHFVIVPHTLCREHGELMHASADAVESCPAPVSRVPSSREPAVHQGPGRHAGEHQHCAQTMPNREPSLRSQHVATCIARDVVSRNLAPADPRVERRSFPQFLLAPKQSPPA